MSIQRETQDLIGADLRGANLIDVNLYWKAQHDNLIESVLSILALVILALVIELEQVEQVADGGHVHWHVGIAQTHDRVLRGYVRDAELFRDHAGAGLL